jgi:hypothetical protein
LAKMMYRLATPPLVMKHLEPLRTKSEPSLRAVVLMADVSDPASRSVRQKEAKAMSFWKGANSRFFCSSVPKRRIGVKARELAIIVVYNPAQPQASSSLTMARSRSPMPTPPYSAGTVQVRKPTSKALRMTSSGNVWPWS